jgi:hypothetical protein
MKSVYMPESSSYRSNGTKFRMLRCHCELSSHHTASIPSHPGPSAKKSAPLASRRVANHFTRFRDRTCSCCRSCLLSTAIFTDRRLVFSPSCESRGGIEIFLHSLESWDAVDDDLLYVRLAVTAFRRILPFSGKAGQASTVDTNFSRGQRRSRSRTLRRAHPRCR